MAEFIRGLREASALTHVLCFLCVAGLVTAVIVYAVKTAPKRDPDQNDSGD